MTLNRHDLSSASPAGAGTLPTRRFEIDTRLPCGTPVTETRRAPALPEVAHCAAAFARGTLLSGPDGPRAIEDLRPGDLLRTADGDPAAVRWIGSVWFDPRRDGDDVGLGALFRVSANPFGENGPGMDLLLGPGARCALRHAKLQTLLGRQAVLVPVADEADSDRIIPVRPAGAVQLFHLMLDRHALLRVGPLELESYHPGRALESLAARGLRDVFLSLFPQIESVADFGQLSFSRTTRDAIDAVLSH